MSKARMTMPARSRHRTWDQVPYAQREQITRERLGTGFNNAERRFPLPWWAKGIVKAARGFFWATHGFGAWHWGKWWVTGEGPARYCRLCQRISFKDNRAKKYFESLVKRSGPVKVPNR